MFFFKQETAYEIRLSLVGSEVCRRDRFLERLFRGIDPVTKATFLKTVTAMNENLDELLKGE